MDYKTILFDLKQKKYHPIYFLYGDEPYYIDLISNYIEHHVLSEIEQQFNLTVLYGLDTNLDNLINAAKRLPMNALYQVIILKEAQSMRNIEKLQAYIEQSVKTTILVIAYKKDRFDKRTKFAKAIVKHTLVWESKKIYEDKMPAWISGYVQTKGYDIEPEANVVLTEYLGNNLSKMTNELNKLFVNLPMGQMIQLKDIEENIGISREYNVFELQKALGYKNVIKITRIVNYFKANVKANPFVLIIGTLYTFFSKIYLYHTAQNGGDMSKILGVHPYFIRDYKAAAGNYNLQKTEQAFAVIQEYDMRSKGVNNVNTPEGELLREMVYKILH